jgi:hypothetical protein
VSGKDTIVWREVELDGKIKMFAENENIAKKRIAGSMEHELKLSKF